MQTPETGKNTNTNVEAGKDNILPISIDTEALSQVAPGVQDQIDKTAREIGAIAGEALNIVNTPVPSRMERVKRIGRAAGNVAMYGAGAVVLGGLGYIAFRALKGTPVEAVAAAVADAGADAATAVADAATDAVAAAFR